MRWGNCNLKDKPVFLAPMEEVTDKVFRNLCRELGADIVFTEFVSSDALVRKIKKTVAKLENGPSGRPVSIQLYGTDPSVMAEAARIVEEYNPDTIDLNFGCPVRKIATRGGGAGLLKDIPKLLAITREVVHAVKIPVTVKTRLGWDHHSLVIEDLAMMLQDCGIAGLTIHGRTRDQMYSGVADWSLIGRIKMNPGIKIPIIGNGDVDSGIKAAEMFQKYGVDGVMVGRACIGNPWIFSEIRHFLDTGTTLPLRKIPEQADQLIHMARLYIEEKGIPSGILHMRRHIAKNFKGLPGFREKRIALLRTIHPEVFFSILDEVKHQYADYYE